MPEYRTPGVYIEEISGGPRPVQASSTTNTGFIAVLTLPGAFVPGRGHAAGMLVPTLEEQVRLSWNRALSFRPLALEDDAEGPKGEAKPDAAKSEAAKSEAAKSEPGKAEPKSTRPAEVANRFQKLVGESLPGRWEVGPPDSENLLTLTSEKGDLLRFPVSRTLMSVRSVAGHREWDLAFGADEHKVLEILSAYAIQNHVKHSGTLTCLDTSKKPVTIDAAALHDRLVVPAPSITGMSGYAQWRSELGERLFRELLIESGLASPSRAQAMWDGLPGPGRRAWDQWLRSHPGLLRLELALQGFFENGGATAYIALAIQAHGAAGPNKRTLLQQSFDSVPSVAMLAAPGLEQSWQQAILEYAGPKGRGDLFAVMETPRYLLTREPRGVSLDNTRWVKGDSPYEVGVLETVAATESAELRYLGFANDDLLDRVVPRDDSGYGAAYGPWMVVDNPLSTGPHDRFIIAPPAGHVAGVIAATDLKAGGGVHKAPANEQVAGVLSLVTDISDREQGALNTKGINIIRRRPGAGIRVWGARTTGADPLWRYVNVRRLFLMVERSVRDAVNWAVFLPNNDVTRRDLATTIRSFLFSLWRQGMLDGATHQLAYTVKCDKENNPDVDVRSGILTVDVMFRPLYPAEFVRIRFRQAPMEVPE